MSIKTTLALAVALLVAIGGIWFFGGFEPVAVDQATKTSEQEDQGLVSLFGEEPEAPVHIVFTPASGDTLELAQTDETETPGGRKKWKMTKPVQSDVASWQISTFTSLLTGLKYRTKFAPGKDNQPSESDLGLSPPAAKIEWTDEAGGQYALSVGRPLLSGNNTYVKTGGDDTVYVVERDFSDLIKKKPKDLRDAKLFNFKPAQTKEIKIRYSGGEGDAGTYHLVKTAGDWSFAEPFNAFADNAAIQKIVNAMNGLRAAEWYDQADPKAFGLDSPMLYVELTTEEVVPSEKKEEEAKADENDNSADEQQPQQVQIARFGVSIGEQGPIGGSMPQRYAWRDGDVSTLAAVSQTQIANMIPKLKEWRDMRLVRGDMTQANKLQGAAEGQSFTLSRKDDVWMLNEDVRAEQTAVSDLLKDVKDLKAVAFVDVKEEGVEYGFDAPRGELSVWIPGRVEPYRLTIGAPTDAESRLLTYVRVGEDNIAKVKTEDANKLLREPITYRDHEILSFAASRIEGVHLQRPEDVAYPDVTLAQKAGQWKMTAPVEAPVDGAAVTALTGALGQLRASKIVGEHDPAQYSLSPPQITAVLTLTGVPVEKQPETQPAATEPATTEPAAPQFELGPPETAVLELSKHQNNVYAMTGDSPTIYEVDRTLWDKLAAEMRERAFFPFETSQVTAICISRDGKTQGFTKKGDRWTYDNEPDLPIDPVKVTELIEKVKKLQPDRYMAHSGADLSQYDLTENTTDVQIGLEDGSKRTLKITTGLKMSNNRPVGYAALEGSDVVVALPWAQVTPLRIDVASFEKK